MDTYKNLCTQFYDLDKPDAPLDALNFYLAYAENAHGPILEPMCGTGRYLIPMLQAGLNIEGADPSPYMLAVCKEKCAALGLSPKLYQEYLHQIAEDKKYALIFIPSGSFGLITNVNEIKTNLKIIYDHLLPNGKLVFEIETIHGISKELVEGLSVNGNRSLNTKQKGERILLSTVSSYDKDAQVVETICGYELIREQIIQKENEVLRVRYYHDHEMDTFLKQAGFSKFTRLKAYEHTPPEVNDEMIIYECIK